MQHAWNPANDCQKHVQEQVRAAALLNQRDCSGEAGGRAVGAERRRGEKGTHSPHVRLTCGLTKRREKNRKNDEKDNLADPRAGGVWHGGRAGEVSGYARAVLSSEAIPQQNPHAYT